MKELAGWQNKLTAQNFFPLGTVNDLARALNLPMDPEEAIQQLDLEKPVL